MRKPSHAYRGKVYTVRELAAMAGLSEHSFRDRLRRGWPIAKAVETPKGKDRW